MDSLESKLGEILSSPEKMEQVMKLAGELLGSGAFSTESAASDADESASGGGFAAGSGASGGAVGDAGASGGASGGMPDLSSALPAIMSMLGGAGVSNSGAAQTASSGDTSGGSGAPGGFGNIDPRFMSAAMQVLGALGKDDDSTRLLRALRPHLRAERCERLDHAVQILRISGAIRAAIHSFSGGAGNVQQI